MAKKKKISAIRQARPAKSIDYVLDQAQDLKLHAERAARQWDKFRRKVLIPLARREGYRRGEAWLLKGAHNDALVERVVDLFIDQVRAERLTPALKRLILRAVFKPSPELHLFLRERHIGGNEIRRFVARGVKLRRHWRVSRLNIRSASSARSAMKSGRRKAA